MRSCRRQNTCDVLEDPRVGGHRKLLQGAGEGGHPRELNRGKHPAGRPLTDFTRPGHVPPNSWRDYRQESFYRDARNGVSRRSVQLRAGCDRNCGGGAVLIQCPDCGFGIVVWLRPVGTDTLGPRTSEFASCRSPAGCRQPSCECRYRRAATGWAPRLDVGDVCVQEACGVSDGPSSARAPAPWCSTRRPPPVVPARLVQEARKKRSGPLAGRGPEASQAAI